MGSPRCLALTIMSFKFHTELGALTMRPSPRYIPMDDVATFYVDNRFACLDADILEAVNPRGSKRAWDMDYSRS